MTEEEQTTPAPPHGAVIILDWDFISQVLQLPEGMQVVAVRNDAFRNAVMIHVRGDMLPELERHREPQQMLLQYERVRLPDGRYATLATPTLPQAEETNQP